MDEIRLKYIEMLQAVIARMASNQFALRAWSVGIGTGIIGFAASKDGNSRVALIAVFPTAIFWLLDAYYLALEAEFRDIFQSVCADTGLPNFSFSTKLTARKLFNAWKRPAVWLVHLPVLLLAVAIGGWAWTH